MASLAGGKLWPAMGVLGFEAFFGGIRGILHIYIDSIRLSLCSGYLS